MKGEINTMDKKPIFFNEIKSSPLKVIISIGAVLAVTLIIALCLSIILPILGITALISTSIIAIALLLVLALLPIAFIINSIKK